MPILEEKPGLLEALRGEMTPKFLATRSGQGVPNLVPLISLKPTEDQPDVMFFGNFLLRKSIKNLDADPRVGILVVTPELQGWTLCGDFLEFQRTGPYVERQMSSPLLRYNAYTGIRNAGLIRAGSLRGSFHIPRLKVLSDYLVARLAGIRRIDPNGDGVKMPRQVRREFARMVAVKVLAWIGGDGYAQVIPALSLQPAGDRSLVGRLALDDLPTPPTGARVAANILTFEAISYQIKGRWYSDRSTPGNTVSNQGGKTGRLQVEEIYAGGPPYPGGRVA